MDKKLDKKLDKKNRLLRNNAVPRMVFAGLSVLFQIAWLLVLILWLNEYSVWISLLTGVLTIVVVLQIYFRPTVTAMKLPWIMLIMGLPVMGLTMYLLFEVFGDLTSAEKQLHHFRQESRASLTQNPKTFAQLEAADKSAANRSRYLLNQAGSPLYGGTDVRYFGQAGVAFEAMKEAMEQAESFIFLEYFIVAEDSSFRELREILERKARQGVDVRLMYDDVGSVGYVNFLFAKSLNDSGIRCKVFNPALPVLNLFMNHRDHRKIAVIDGKVAFTGGYNLADEYFGRRFPYGKWKDTGIRLEGEAVRRMTALFLEMWNVGEKHRDDFSRYLQVSHSLPEAKGWVQPFGDDPRGRERLAENVLLDLIYGAEDTLYISTPYLIITDEMRNALTMAAKRGVDVRIVTPGIPDKKTVYQVTRSYYVGLVEAGVRIFEYEPGFCHAKQLLCDSKAAFIGTTNLDFRSLYHHFENNVLFCGCDALEDMARDFQEMFSLSREVTKETCAERSWALRMWQCLLRLFAPLM